MQSDFGSEYIDKSNDFSFCAIGDGVDMIDFDSFQILGSKVTSENPSLGIKIDFFG